MKDGIARALAVLAIVAVAVAQLWPGLSAGLSPPIGWDHGSHLGKAILTWEHLLPSLRGWTDLVEAGVPLNTVYGPTGLMWVLLFRCFTPWLAWHQTYALAFAGFRSLVGLSVYRLARVAGAGRLGAVIAAFIALADQGTHSEGGWFYDVNFGVWPMSLAMCVLFFGIADLLVFVEQGAASRAGRWARARAMLLLGVALFSHQMSLIALAMLMPVLVIVRTSDGRERPALRETLSRALPVLVVAGMIASWWMLPMLGLSAWLDDHGQLYTTSSDVGARMVRGEGVYSGGAWTGVLVSLALASSLFTRGHRRFLALFAVLATLVGTSGWFLMLDMARWLPPLGRIVFPRMMMIAKPAYFALAGVVVSDVMARTAPSMRAALARRGGVMGVVFTLLLVGGFAPDMLESGAALLWRRSTTTTATAAEWGDFQGIWQWVSEQPRDRFFRVAYVNEGTHLGQAAPGYTSRPGHTPGVLVGEAFRNTPDSIDPDALRAINVRYVVHWGGLPPRLSRQCTEVTQRGNAHVCELSDWTNEVVSDVEGLVHPHVINLESTRVRFEPLGARSVIVRRALAPGWHATVDGEPAAITEERVVDSPHLRLMRIAVPPDAHEVVLAYRSTGGLDVLGLLLTVLGLAGVFVITSTLRGVGAARARIATACAGLVARVPPRVTQVIDRRWPAWAIALPFVALCLVVARNASGTHLAYLLDHATVRLLRPLGNDVCELSATDGAARCASAPEVAVQRSSVVVDGRYHSCITAGPANSAPLTITWNVATGGTMIVGAGISDTTQAHGNGASVDLRVDVDGAEVMQLAVPNGRAWVEMRSAIASGDHEIAIRIPQAQGSQRELCVDAIVR
jgi:hypothetical protein